MAYGDTSGKHTGQWIAIASLAIVMVGAALQFYGEHTVLEERVNQLEQSTGEMEMRIYQIQEQLATVPRVPRATQR